MHTFPCLPTISKQYTDDDRITTARVVHIDIINGVGGCMGEWIKIPMSDASTYQALAVKGTF